MFIPKLDHIMASAVVTDLFGLVPRARGHLIEISAQIIGGYFCRTVYIAQTRLMNNNERQKLGHA